MPWRLVVASAIAVVATAAFVPGSGLGSSAGAVHARLGAGAIRSDTGLPKWPPYLGSVVALSADGTTALVSAPGVDKGKGAVYVYHVSGPGSWASSSTPAATLTNSSGAAGDEFGDQIALSADGTTAFVGAPFRDQQAGAVDVFHVLSEDAWASTSTPTATLTVADGSGIGLAFAASADGTTLLVGALDYNSGRGGAYVFRVSSEDAWVSSSTPTATLSNALESPDDSGVGAPVALSADGTTALLSDAEAGLGGAYVFHVTSEAAWVSSSAPTAILSASGPDDLFGDALALSGDGTTAFLAAPGQRFWQAGAVEVFHATSESSWVPSSTPAATLTYAGGSGEADFAWSLAASADGATAVISASGFHKAAGAVLVYHVSDAGAWTSNSVPTAKLINSAGHPNDFLGGNLDGSSLVMSTDGATVLVGALGADWRTGAAYVFHASSASAWATSSTPAATLTNSALPRPVCVVPRLVGEGLHVAEVDLWYANCGLGKVSRVHSSHRKKGYVLSQSPRPRKHLPAGARIKLTVGK